MNTYFVYAKDVFDSFVYMYYLTNLNGDKLILAPIEMVIGAFIIGVIVTLIITAIVHHQERAEEEEAEQEEEVERVSQENKILRAKLSAMSNANNQVYLSKA